MRQALNYDVCVVGCGIVGSTTAIAMALRGLNVLVVEHRSVPLRGSTEAGFGALTPYSDPFFVGETALFAEKSLTMYREDWLPRLHEVTGQAVPLSSTGLLQLFRTKEKFEREIHRFESDCISGYRPKIINAASIRTLEPNVSQETVGALFHPEPWIDLRQYMGAIEAALMSRPNLEVKFDTTVRDITLSQNQHVNGLLSSGEEFSAGAMVICTGLEPFERAPLRSFPIKWVRGDGVAVRTKDNTPLFKHNIYSSPAFIAPRSTGEMLLGSTYVDEGIPPAGTPQPDTNKIEFGSMQKIASACNEVSDQLEHCIIERTWRGWRPASEDDYPILGTDPNFKNVIYAQAFLGLGITLSVAVANSIMEYITTGQNQFPLQMSPERFG